MKRIRAIAVVLCVLLVVSNANLAEAASLKVWKDFPFFGSTKAQIRKALGKPDDPGELDGYRISDSPDFMMYGMIGYENGKVACVCAILRPKLTYKKVRDIQLQADGVKFVSEDKNGVLFVYKKPPPNGPKYVLISPPDDPSNGPMFMESLTNPLGKKDQEKPAKTASQPSNKAPQGKPHIDLSLLDKDVFDWQMLDDDGKLELLGKIKRLWRATGTETSKNAIDAQTLMKKIRFPDQSLVVDQACEAAGIDPAPFRKMRDTAHKPPSGK